MGELTHEDIDKLLVTSEYTRMAPCTCGGKGHRIGYAAQPYGETYRIECVECDACSHKWVTSLEEAKQVWLEVCGATTHTFQITMPAEERVLFKKHLQDYLRRGDTLATMPGLDRLFKE